MQNKDGPHPVYAYFKLFNSIKDEHEVELARLELEAMVGAVEIVRNFADEFRRKPLRPLVDATQVTKTKNESDSVRFQDFVTHELAYGHVQGFTSATIKLKDVPRLARRLGYTREIYIVSEAKSWKRFVRAAFPHGAMGKNCSVFFSHGTVAVRVITDQYFLENSEYVTKVTPSLDRGKIRLFADCMFDNLMRFVYRIPASGRARVGKRFLDYLAERGEGSLYLSHGLHPYKGKFHPKMTRALVNIVRPDDKGTIVDNFAGSGTLLVESCLMGFDSYGIEINPMSVLMANAKCALMRVKLGDLDEAAKKFLAVLHSELELMQQQSDGQATLETMGYPPESAILEEIKSVAPDVYDDFAPKHVLEEIVVARRVIEGEFEGDIRDLLLLGLAMAISNLKGKKNKDFQDQIGSTVEDIYRRCYLFNYLREVLQFDVGCGTSIEADASDLRNISALKRAHGNVNSPPYSTALDYIRNDLAQLALLGMVKNAEGLRELEAKMGGNPRAEYDTDAMHAKVTENPAGLPDYAMVLIRLFEHYGKSNHAYRLYEFFDLIKRSFGEQMRILEKGSKIATVIGNNHFKLTDEVDALGSSGIRIGEGICPVEVHSVKNNMKPLDVKQITGESLLSRYSGTLPVKVSVSGASASSAQDGVYVEVENERVILLLAMMVGFRPCMVINRYIEKTLRGNIRYESIVIMEKP